jgi:hypothetical protein
MGILHGLEVPAWETILGVLNFLITWQVVVVFFLIVSSIVLVCSIIPLVCNAVYGWELSYWFFNAVVNVGSSPDINGTVTVHTLIKEDYTGFRHYLYDHGGCELWIVQWVLARSRGQDLPTYLDQRRNLRAPYEEYVRGWKEILELNEKSKRPSDGN